MYDFDLEDEIDPPVFFELFYIDWNRFGTFLKKTFPQIKNQETKPVYSI